MAGSSPRQTQVTALEWIEKLPPEIKYIICQIPVGGGKSPIALNVSAWIANSFGNGVILTPQKILQRQYEESFDPRMIASMYGKSNYSCEKRKTNCDIGSSIKPACEACPYKMAYQNARRSPNVVLNYKIALLYSMIGVELMKKKSLIVFDECHTLENHLTEFLAVTISERGCKRLHIPWRECKTMAEGMAFLKDRYLPALNNRITQLSELVKEIEDRNLSGKLSDKDLDTIREYKSYCEQSDSLTDIIQTPSNELKEMYVYIPEKTTFRFKEVYGARVFASLLEPLSQKFLFMSSTILDKVGFCEDLGLNPKQAAFISLESEFPVENRPVIYDPVMKMVYGWDGPDRADDRKRMIAKIVKLATGKHAGHSGVIHTGSFVVANWLVRELEGKIPQKIMHHGPESGYKRDGVIDAFCTNDGTLKLLISPSVTEGLDLKDELARFNIIVKVPYPFLGDAWVKRRMELSSSWYTRQAMIGIIQACGRAVRGPKDWAFTYILDSSFESLYRRFIRFVPKWWRDAFID